LRHLILLFLLISQGASAATWKVEIKNGQTSEVKTYKFSSEGMHKLELSTFDFVGCLLEIKKPSKLESSETTFVSQQSSIFCPTPTGGYFVHKICANIPSDLDKKIPTLFEVVEDGAKFETKKGKKGKFSSYAITLWCE
jgi:hypothetical protein